ncbi:glutamate decarboxylase-like isoform X2 [Varroa jacobsoni]|uniref:Glutamate decarboxylase n=1 Tax=Varroa destructor TaxID=109461 RepID=A0A7M7KJX1_VARDE|nr:glutamate decarboxylase-like isoform X2 [Varroa destructor]XP_022700270.1 glutamate decarboxylase-like isoform X2 [Varroa jacobsoni]
MAENVENLGFKDLYPYNINGKAETRAFLLKVVSILLDYVDEENDRTSKILDFKMPEELEQILDLNLPDKGLPLGDLLKDCRSTLKWQVKTGHPHFFNQLSSGLDIVSLAGEWLTSVANTNMFTYEIAPVFILMENVVLKKMREYLGFVHGDSILAPGGSISNMYAVMGARHKMFPNYKKLGLKALPQLVMYTSVDSHYSAMGAAASCGLGTDNVIQIGTDSMGRMRVDKLEEAVLATKAKGHVPFFVNCTCGTTVVGAFDPINPIADLCQKYGMWLHIDAAWGGGVLLSKKHRHLMAGVERANSVTWNPHKLMGTHLQCSTIHFRQDGILLGCNQMCAEYLFQQDKHYDVSFDTGDKVPQCGRRNDIFKLWLMWRAKGTEGFEAHIDQLFDISQYLVKRIKEMPEKFHLIQEPEMVNVLFWYIPQRLRDQPQSKERIAELGRITAQLKARMMNTGTLMITYQPLRELPNFFRNIVSNSAVTKDDIDFLLAEMDRLGNDL